MEFKVIYLSISDKNQNEFLESNSSNEAWQFSSKTKLRTDSIKIKNTECTNYPKNSKYKRYHKLATNFTLEKN